MTSVARVGVEVGQEDLVALVLAVLGRGLARVLGGLGLGLALGGRAALGLGRGAARGFALFFRSLVFLLLKA